MLACSTLAGHVLTFSEETGYFTESQFHVKLQGTAVGLLYLQIIKKMSSAITEQAEILVFLELFHSIWSSENYADACWLQYEKEKKEQREVWG